MLQQRAYLVADLPEAVAEQVRALRVALGTDAARLPVGITLAGSSGLGNIALGTPLEHIRSTLERTLADFAAFETRFTAIRCFPGTSIAYLAPENRVPFDQLHQALQKSGLPFQETPWPYTPHCTLRTQVPLSQEDKEEIQQLPFPDTPFQISSITLRTVEPRTLRCQRLLQWRLYSRSS